MKKLDVLCHHTASDDMETGDAVKQQWKTGTLQPLDGQHSARDGERE